MGLTTEEALRRLSEIGPNEPASKAHSTLPRQALELFLNPLVLILLISSAISAALGEQTSASIIALIVLLSAAVNFYQTYRSQRAVDALRSKVAVTATVHRDGKWIEIPAARLFLAT